MTSQAARLGAQVPVTRRELSVLAAISLATVAFIGGVAEIVARRAWPEQEHNRCYSVAADGRRQLAGCTTRLKNAEGPWVVMSYNECGYRSPHPCGPKPPGTRRIVVMGTSIADGLYVPYEQHFTARLERSLTRRCGFPVEIQNTASLGHGPTEQWQLLPEVQRLAPDAVIFVTAPFDLGLFRARSSGDAAPTATPNPTAAPVKTSVLTRVRLALRESRALLIAQHYFLSSAAKLYRAYELGREDDALRVPVSPDNTARYAHLEEELGLLADRLRAQGAPLVLAAVPNRIQATLLSSGMRPEGVDPWIYARTLAAASQRHGVVFADVFQEFARTPHGERLYYPVDSHPTGEASALIARATESALLSGAVPAFAQCRASGS